MTRTLFESTPSPPRRSPVAAALSLVAHGVTIAAAMLVATAQWAPPRATTVSFTFLTFAAPVIPLERIERLQLTPPLEASEPAPASAPDVSETRPPPLPPPQPEARPQPAARVEPPPPTPPVVTVGSFVGAQNAATRPQLQRDIQNVSFDTSQAVAPDLKLTMAAVGTFDLPRSTARTGTDRPITTSVPSAFEGAQALSPAERTGRVVSDAGFGTSTSALPATAPLRGQVRPTGFGDVQPAAAADAAVRPSPSQIVTPVEIVFKPTPTYSDEARTLKIEGEVVLEVEFTASGQARVIRIVQSLGHGLDEMAARAAQQIRFKPAVVGGHPADSRTQVQIVFRLT